MSAAVSPAVVDVSRAVAQLDANPDDDAAAELVAANLGYQFSRLTRNAARTIAGRDVRAALLAHGASVRTAERWAQTIGTKIRLSYLP